MYGASLENGGLGWMTTPTHNHTPLTMILRHPAVYIDGVFDYIRDLLQLFSFLFPADAYLVQTSYDL